MIAPMGEGPWPTVVVFHGDPRTASKSWHRPDAQLIAEQGRVVFLPAWGHGDSAAIAELGTRAWWDLLSAELTCAVAFARSNAEQFGGDSGPHHSVRAFGRRERRLDGRAERRRSSRYVRRRRSGGGAAALVPIDTDWVLGGGWDADVREDPEMFYTLTPWRFLDGSQDVQIYVAVTENTGPEFVRSVQPDPATSSLSYRHADIDLAADLEERGFLGDGDFGLKESSEYAYQVLVEAGYDPSFVVLPGATPHELGHRGHGSGCRNSPRRIAEVGRTALHGAVAPRGCRIREEEKAERQIAGRQQLSVAMVLVRRSAIAAQDLRERAMWPGLFRAVHMCRRGECRWRGYRM